ncbi:hypothetical protein P7C70_g8257, partial [Phenoliferia sp. Uapishka_3]
MSHHSTTPTDTANSDDIIIVGELGAVEPEREVSVDMDLGTDNGDVGGDDDTFFAPIELDATIRAAEQAAIAADIAERRRLFNLAVDNTFVDARNEVESGAARQGSEISPTPVAPFTPAPRDVATGHVNPDFNPFVLFGGHSYKECVRMLAYINYVTYSYDKGDPFLYEAAVRSARDLIDSYEKGNRNCVFWKRVLKMATEVAEANNTSVYFSTGPHTTYIPILDDSLYRSSARTFALNKATLFCKSGRPRAIFPKGSLDGNHTAFTDDAALSEVDDTNTPAGIRFGAVSQEVRDLNKMAGNAAKAELLILRQEHQDAADEANSIWYEENGIVVDENGVEVDVNNNGATSPVYSPSSPRYSPSSPDMSMPDLEEIEHVPDVPEVAGETLADFLFTPVARPTAASLNDRLAQVAASDAIPVPWDPRKAAAPPAALRKPPSAAKSTPARVAQQVRFSQSSNARADAASRPTAYKRPISDLDISSGFEHIPIIQAPRVLGFDDHLASVDALHVNRHEETSNLSGLGRETALRAAAFRACEKSKLVDIIEGRLSNMPRDVKRKLALNEYVNLEQINGYIAGTTFTTPLLAGALSDLVVEKPSAALPFVDAHSWIRAFDIYKDLRGHLYDFEKPALEKLRDFMSAKFSKSPSIFNDFIIAEAAVRRTVGTPGNPESVADIPAAISSELAEMSLVARSSIQAKANNKGINGSASTVLGPSGEVCKTWNRGYAGGHEKCRHIDQCSAQGCSSFGHGAWDCPTTGGLGTNKPPAGWNGNNGKPRGGNGPAKAARVAI